MLNKDIIKKKRTLLLLSQIKKILKNIDKIHYSSIKSKNRQFMN